MYPLGQDAYRSASVMYSRKSPASPANKTCSGKFTDMYSHEK